MSWQPLWLSFELAATTMLLLLLVATPMAWFLAFTRIRGRSVLEAVFALPLVLPPTVLGYFLLVAIGSRSPVGQWYQAVFGSTFAFSFTGLVFASMLYSLPFAVQPMQNAFESLERELSEASRTLGLNAWQSFFRVLLPGARIGVVTGAVLSFAHTLGEFGVVLMIGGSIPGKTKVASIAIYEYVENLEYPAANAMALVLLAVSFIVLSVVYYYNRRLSRMVLG